MATITWSTTNNTGFTISGSNLTKHSVNGHNNGICATNETFSTNIEFELTYSDPNDTKVGIAKDPFNDGASKTWQDINYGFADGSVIINGAIETPDVSFSYGTSPTVKLVAASSTLTWYVDDSIVHTITNFDTTSTFYGLAAAYTQNATLTGNYINGSSSGGGSGGGEEEEESTPINTDGTPFIEHILYLNTVVPK